MFIHCLKPSRDLSMRYGTCKIDSEVERPHKYYGNMARQGSVLRTLSPGNRWLIRAYASNAVPVRDNPLHRKTETK